MTEDQFDKLMRDAAETFHRTPDAPLDEMWKTIESRAGLRTGASEESSSPMARAMHRFHAPTWLAIAATLVIGIGIGRGSRSIGHEVVPVQPQQVAAVEPSPATTTRDDTALDRPYELETAQYLGQTAALLTALPSEAKSARVDQQFAARATDLLARTRLLMDSPAADEPAMHDLLEDLELVLAQVVRLRANGTRTDLDIINRALEQRDVIPRLRTAVADISAN
jgi:hypothetical protein